VRGRPFATAIPLYEPRIERETTLAMKVIRELRSRLGVFRSVNELEDGNLSCLPVPGHDL
jgi:hypothetical protein